MDMLNKQLVRIQQQLSGLTASQKMLTGALVAIMVMTLLYWGRHAGTAVMEPVLDQDFSPQVLGQIQARLQGKHIEFTTSGARILVPADRKMEILADLAYAKLLPQNTQNGFDQIASKLSPFSAPSEHETMNNRAKEAACAQVIGLFPDVTSAQVMIDATTRRRLSANVTPSAIINITTGGGANVKQITEAATAVVSGAKAGLDVGNISVVIDGRKQRVRSSQEGVAGFIDGDDYFEMQARYEQQKEDKIRERLRNVDGLLVAVSVQINNEKVRRQQQKIDPKNTITKERKTRTKESQTTDGMSTTTGEPGTIPNVVANGPMDVGTGAGGSSTTTEDTETENEILESKELIFTETTPGAPTVVSASIGVPRSYLLRGLNIANPASGPAPAEPVFQAYAANELTKIEKAVRAAAGMGKETDVSVAQFDDVPQPVAPTLPQTATASIPMMLGKHSKEIALTGLALVSLFMVSMMVKKSAAAPALVAAAAAAGGGGASTPHLGTGEALAGEAGSGNTLLDGMELDEESVRTQQMLDQVSTLVADNPDAAATLVKRWLNRD